MSFLKSPWNYVGGKYRLLDQLLPLFPAKIDRFFDLFCGGLDVSMNVKASRYLANDRLAPLISVYRHFSERGLLAVEEVEGELRRFNLLGCPASGNYLALRDEYNREPSAARLFALVSCSFNHQMRFNRAGHFNMPVGRAGKASYNPVLRANLVRQIQWLIDYRPVLCCEDYASFLADSFAPDDFVYCDPPYLLTTATYNSQWGVAEDGRLCEYLDRLDARGVRFALSNVLEHGGKENVPLVAWARRYRVVEMSFSYANSSYQKKQRASSREVLVVNY